MGVPRQTLTLDVSRRNASRHIVHLGEGDVNGTMLVVSVTEDGVPFGCDGYQPFLMIPLRDGSVYRKEGTAAGNVVTITVDESGLGNVNGRMPGAYVSLEGEDGTVTSTQRFDVLIAESRREAVAPDTFVTDMEALTARIAALESALGVTAPLSDDDIDDTLDDGTEPSGGTEQDDGTGEGGA